MHFFLNQPRKIAVLPCILRLAPKVIGFMRVFITECSKPILCPHFSYPNASDTFALSCWFPLLTMRWQHKLRYQAPESYQGQFHTTFPVIPIFLRCMWPLHLIIVFLNFKSDNIMTHKKQSDIDIKVKHLRLLFKHADLINNFYITWKKIYFTFASLTDRRKVQNSKERKMNVHVMN